MTINREFILANHPDIAEAFRAEGRIEGLTAGRTEGASGELARILAVEAQAMPGHEQLIATLKADGKTTGPEAAVQVLAAEKAKKPAQLAALRTDAPNPAPAAGSADGDQAAHATTAQAEADANLPVEERAKKQWEASAAVQAEFRTLAAYTGYLKAKERGAVK